MWTECGNTIYHRHLFNVFLLKRRRKKVKCCLDEKPLTWKGQILHRSLNLSTVYRFANCSQKA